MTVRQLAALAGTSPGTVSKAFSGAKDISEETRERIFQIAREEGCFEKYDKGPRPCPLAVILCPETESEYYGRMTGLLSAALRRAGWDAVIATTGFDPEAESRLFSALAYRMGADGVILLGSGSTIRNPEKLPLVVIGGENIPEGADVVHFHTYGAVLEAVQALKEEGHRRIGFIGEKNTQSKHKMLCDALRQCGIPVNPDLFCNQPLRFEAGGYAAMQMLLSLHTPPTAVLAAYDYMAIGALRCCRDQGLSVPEDISLVGMDDLSVDPFLEVPLSSICTHLEVGCDQVVSLLVAKKENRHFQSRQPLVIPSTFQRRASLGRVREECSDIAADRRNLTTERKPI